MAKPRDPLAESAIGPSFIVGIDLGTTNSAVAYVDMSAPAAGRSAIKVFKIPQLTGLGEFRPMPVLPSFLYIPGEFEIDPQAIRHPWPKPSDTFAGVFARDQGAQVPARLVSSAKSWLCHDRVDRNARILPWGAPGEVPKMSPVQASAACLEHIKQAWNHARGNEEELFIENQKVILTVPASFDEVARELTLAAARQAGYRDITLIEEPLAAFYSWIAAHEHTWHDHVQPNQLILICDVGGGTTDFTLVTLTAVEGGSPRFERIAVGDHLILGGDNVDLALARRVEAQWGGKRPPLDTNRWKALCHQCRQAKEAILSGQAQSHRITLMGTGSRLIAGTITAELDRAVIDETLLDGFFPLIDAEASIPPAQRPAIAEFGQHILELGCGWGSLSLWMARTLPNAQIVSVSNSASQGDFIRAKARSEGLSNLTVVTADMNDFEAAPAAFDRIVSVEMFEHMANWRALLTRAKAWLRPDGRLFLHVFTHRSTPYRFDVNDEADWIAQHFFTGGVMPSHDLARQFPDLFDVVADWRWSGEHYARTAEAWLVNYDRNAETIRPILAQVYGDQALLWGRRWRLFFLATSGLFGHRGGTEWGVSHYLMSPAGESPC